MTCSKAALVALVLLTSLLAGCSQTSQTDNSSDEDVHQEVVTEQQVMYVPTVWNEDESPNYVRLVGPAQTVCTLAPGEVRYGECDELGRATKVEALITKELMDAGRSRERAENLPDPVGWGHNEEVTIELPTGAEYSGWMFNRSHLLAKSLGGNDELHNLVCATRMQNVGANNGQGGMALMETAIRDWLDTYPEVEVSYVATPVYEGSELLPRSVFVDVKSSDGALDEQVEVYNAAKGYLIDYVDGSFSPLSETL